MLRPFGVEGISNKVTHHYLGNIEDEGGCPIRGSVLPVQNVFLALQLSNLPLEQLNLFPSRLFAGVQREEAIFNIITFQPKPLQHSKNIGCPGVECSTDVTQRDLPHEEMRRLKECSFPSNLG